VVLPLIQYISCVDGNVHELYEESADELLSLPKQNLGETAAEIVKG
jgi:hypothetical protein